MPFNLGPMEMLFVMVVLLLVFGAKRLPELGSGLGKGIREFRRTMKDMNEEIVRPVQAAELPRQGAWAYVQPPATAPDAQTAGSAVPATAEPGAPAAS